MFRRLGGQTSKCIKYGRKNDEWFCNQELFSDRALCMICQKPEETSGTLLSMMTGQSMLSVSEKMEISPSLGH